MLSWGRNALLAILTRVPFEKGSQLSPTDRPTFSRSNVNTSLPDKHLSDDTIESHFQIAVRVPLSEGMTPCHTVVHPDHFGKEVPSYLPPDLRSRVGLGTPYILRREPTYYFSRDRPSLFAFILHRGTTLPPFRWYFAREIRPSPTLHMQKREPPL